MTSWIFVNNYNRYIVGMIPGQTYPGPDGESPSWLGSVENQFLYSHVKCVTFIRVFCLSSSIPDGRLVLSLTLMPSGELITSDMILKCSVSHVNDICRYDLKRGKKKIHAMLDLLNRKCCLFEN